MMGTRVLSTCFLQYVLGNITAFVSIIESFYPHPAHIFRPSLPIWAHETLKQKSCTVMKEGQTSSIKLYQVAFQCRTWTFIT